MLNKIIRFSLDNRLIVLILSALLLVLGTFSLLRTEVDIFPDLNAPTVTVMTEAPGLATEEVEQLVTYPIEMAVNGAQSVENVRSYSSTGFSAVSVIFSDHVDMQTARQIIAERLDRVAEQLPEAAEAPVIGPPSSILGEILIVGLTSDSLSLAELRTIADRNLAPALRGVSGVSSVSVIGGEELEYQVVLDRNAMNVYGVSLAEVEAALQGMNSNGVGGIVNSYGSEYVVKTEFATLSEADMEAVVVRSDADGTVTVGDIATVVKGRKTPVIGSASVRAQEAVILTVTKQPGVGTIGLTDRLLDCIELQRRSLPESLVVSTDIFAQRDFIDNSIGSLATSLFEGALMVVLVLFFFMMNVRATVVSLIALPMSIIITVLILHLFGLTINTMSLGGIAIAIGSLVDDAIVDVENVQKRLRQNSQLTEGERRRPLAVVFSASAEVRMPIFNSSLIIVAGFMPLFFLSGVEGRMLIPLGIAFVVSLAASTIVALTLTPVVCSLLLTKSKAEDEAESRVPLLARVLMKGYRKALASALAHRRAWLGGIAGAFVVAVALFFTLGRGFLPAFNEGSFTINVSALPGISLEESDRVGRMAEEIILSVPEIKTVARKTGRAELDEHSLGTSVSEIEAPYRSDGRSRAEIAAELRRKLAVIPGAVVEIGQPITHRIDAMLSGTEAAVVYKVYGTDLDQLRAVAEAIKVQMVGVPGVEDVAVEQQIDRPEISIVPRRQVLAKYGVTPADFKAIVETATRGRVVSTVYDGGFPRDLTLKVELGDDRLVADRLADLPVDTRLGAVPLSELAEIRSTTGPNAINRENAMRRIVVSANVEGRDVGSAVREIDRLIEQNVPLPEGYTVVESGQAQTAAAATNTLVLTALLAFLVIFALLYYEYKDLRQALIIMVNMPLALIGGVVILKLTGKPLDIPAIIGFVALMGIATRNGMLLLSRYNALTAGSPGSSSSATAATKAGCQPASLPSTDGLTADASRKAGCQPASGSIPSTEWTDSIESSGADAAGASPETSLRAFSGASPGADAAKKAVMEGSVDRLLPIIMTALTSALALLPLALRGTAPGNEIQSPLAIVILGGLATSTLLNLFITPILYLAITRRSPRRS